MNWYVKAMMHYSDFEGRARRKEYWNYVLYNFLFSIAAVAIDFFIAAGADIDFFGFVKSLAMIIYVELIISLYNHLFYSF